MKVLITGASSGIGLAMAKYLSLSNHELILVSRKKDKLEEIQGKHNTFFAGEILSFGDMEDTCASSKDIVERFF